MASAANLRMMRPEQSAQAKDVEVTLEDQQNINLFSKLTARHDQLTTRVDSLKNLLDACTESIQESENLILMEDAESVPIKIGDVFWSVRSEDVQRILEREQEEVQAEMESVKMDVAGVDAEMTRLKAMLYAKFGTSINLERD